jgi:hypothetical protein
MESRGDLFNFKRSEDIANLSSTKKCTYAYLHLFMMTKSQELFLEEATSLYKVLSITEKRISDFTFVPVVMKCLPWLTQGARVQLSLDKTRL